MEWILGLVLFFFMVGWVSSRKKPEKSSDHEGGITTTEKTTSEPATRQSSGDSSGGLSGKLTPVGDSEYCLNPKSPLPLTLRGVDKELAQSVKNQLDSDSWGGAPARLAYLFARHNLQCPQLDSFVDEAKRQVRASVEQRVSSSPEWQSAGEKDRVDLLREFQFKAIDALECKPAYEDDAWRTLLLETPADFTADDELVERFSGRNDLYEVYVSNLGFDRGAVAVPADAYYRKEWEVLVDLGLARRGKDIPARTLVEGLRMKDINEFFVDRLDKKFTRKAPAAEFAASQSDLYEVLGKHISLREMFEIVVPTDIDAERVKKLFRYAVAQAKLLHSTYQGGNRTLEQCKYNSEYKSTDECWCIDAADCCKLCASHHGKQSKKKPAKLPPFHIGCCCELELQ